MKKTFLLLMFGLFAAGCASRQMVKPVQNTKVEPAPAAVQSANAAEDELSSRHSDWQSVPQLATVYFDYDKSELLPAARATLKTNAEYLKENSDITLLVEGNCDERGTIEYNLALGDRRAATVRDYYVMLGVQKKRIAVISYGSEKPVDPGHTEAAWQKNRRADTKIRSAKVANNIRHQ